MRFYLITIYKMIEKLKKKLMSLSIDEIAYSIEILFACVAILWIITHW